MKLKDIIDQQYGLSKFPGETPYAMAYVPYQALATDIYSADHGFAMGTMYPNLDKPFYGSKCGDSNDKT